MEFSALKTSWLLASGLALVIAVVFLFVVRRGELPTASAWQQWILRWGHAIVWPLLALSFASRAFDFSGALFLGLIALAMYVLFVTTLLRT